MHIICCTIEITPALKPVYLYWTLTFCFLYFVVRYWQRSVMLSKSDAAGEKEHENAALERSRNVPARPSTLHNVPPSTLHNEEYEGMGREARIDLILYHMSRATDARGQWQWSADEIARIIPRNRQRILQYITHVRYG